MSEDGPVTCVESGRPRLHPVGMRLLVVEDEPRLAETLRRGLIADGFQCDVAHDGADGLWRASNSTYAAIVLDLLLPGLNGFTVCRRLRQHDNWTPVLILTAKDGDYDLAEALECGADDFMSKPFSFVVLGARLRALIRRRHVARPPALAAGELTLDLFTGECRVGARPLELTARERSVLTALLHRHPGLVAKHEILDEVWGSDFDGDVNIVDVYLSHLRRKLAAMGAEVRIVNVRGAGFRIEPGAGRP